MTDSGDTYCGIIIKDFLPRCVPLYRMQTLSNASQFTLGGAWELKQLQLYPFEWQFWGRQYGSQIDFYQEQTQTDSERRRLEAKAIWIKAGADAPRKIHQTNAAERGCDISSNSSVS